MIEKLGLRPVCAGLRGKEGVTATSDWRKPLPVDFFFEKNTFRIQISMISLARSVLSSVCMLKSNSFHL